MKKYRTTGRVILMGISVLVLVFTLSACQCSSGNEITPSATNPTANITSTPLTILSIAGGNVLVMRSGDKQWVNGEVGTALEVDDKIKTGAGGHATITFFEGSAIELEGETEVSLSELNLEGTASHIGVKQTLGKTLSRVKKLVDPASSYDVETPAVIASVRGTTLSVLVAEDGTTVVGNIEGQVSVTAQGVEIELPEGSTSTVLPGEPPGKPQTTATTAIGRVAEISPTPTPDIVKIGISKACDVPTAFPGDNVTYTYYITNEGNMPLSDIIVTDNKAGQPLYVSGDDNVNANLDTSETWVFETIYTIKDSETGHLTNTAVVSGTEPGNLATTASAAVTINVTDIIVEITSLEQGQIVGKDIVISGYVNDHSITKAVLTLNGSPRTTSVVDGQFSEGVELVLGITNTITITVTKFPDIVRSTSVILEPEGK